MPSPQLLIPQSATSPLPGTAALALFLMSGDSQCKANLARSAPPVRLKLHDRSVWECECPTCFPVAFFGIKSLFSHSSRSSLIVAFADPKTDPAAHSHSSSLCLTRPHSCLNHMNRCSAAFADPIVGPTAPPAAPRRGLKPMHTKQHATNNQQATTDRSRQTADRLQTKTSNEQQAP